MFTIYSNSQVKQLPVNLRHELDTTPGCSCTAIAASFGGIFILSARESEAVMTQKIFKVIVIMCFFVLIMVACDLGKKDRFDKTTQEESSTITSTSQKSKTPTPVTASFTKTPPTATPTATATLKPYISKTPTKTSVPSKTMLPVIPPTMESIPSETPPGWDPVATVSTPEG